MLANIHELTWQEKFLFIYFFKITQSVHNSGVISTFPRTYALQFNTHIK